jgi:hypothetical protein
MNVRTQRALKRRQGAVLVEGLVVASLLTLCLAVGVFFHQLYSARLSSMREARAAAWQGALAGCGGGVANALLSSLGVITLVTLADELELIQGPAWLTEMGRRSGGPAPRSVNAGPILGGRSYQLEYRVSLACNDYADQAAESSNLAAIFQTVRDFVMSR